MLLILCTPGAAAQDKIHLVGGRRIISGRVLEPSAIYVRYYNYDDGDSSVKHIEKYRVNHVQYADGHIWRLQKTKEDANREAKAKRDRRRANQVKGMPNAITLDFPTYMDIGNYPGVVVGIGYERFLDKRGKFSVNVTVSRYWAGTNAAGKLSSGEERANIQGGYFMPGFLYHTARTGNAAYIDFSVGAAFPIGNLKRHDVAYGYSTYKNTIYPITTLAAALVQANFCLHLGGHFIFTTTLSGGPMLNAANTRGSLWLAGFKLGGRF